VHKTIDLAIAADWEYDRDFISLLEDATLQEGLTCQVVWPENLTETIQKASSDEIRFRFLFDRASTSSPEFLVLQKLVENKGTEVLEPIEKVRWASDKATMHLEFIAHGLHTPNTIILPPLSSGEPFNLAARDLSLLGIPFIIKPANTTGGSLGVVDSALSLDDIWRARQVYPTDKYLIQEKVRPCEKEGRRFWFRGFYILGDVLAAWWDDQTHVYSELIPDEIERYHLQWLFPTVEKIGQVCQLRFFSTEIVLTAAEKLLCVDYVNEPCDMRLKSRHFDGVPDSVVRRVAVRVAEHVRKSPSPSPLPVF
jgi:hypothetical protein